MVPAITIAIITAAFLSGIQTHQCQCHTRHKHAYHRAANDRIGPLGNPSDWPNDGPGFHDKPKNYHEMEQDEDDYFIGAK